MILSNDSHAVAPEPKTMPQLSRRPHSRIAALLGLAAICLCGPVGAEPVPSVDPMTKTSANPGLPRLSARLSGGGDIRIVAFGSSSTEGIGASSPNATYPALLQRDLSESLRLGVAGRPAVTMINRGRGGDDAEAMARRLQRDVLAERPDLVIWQTGSNDPMTGVPLERFVALTRDGIAAIRATGADVVLMDQQWCRRLSGIDGAERYGAALHALAEELSVPVIRRHALMQTWVAKGLLTPTQMIGPDGLHMTDAGYDRLAKAASAQILVQAGLSPASTQAALPSPAPFRN